MKSIIRIIAWSSLAAVVVNATENLPQIPFAEPARLPEPNQFVLTPWYNYSVFRKVWIGDNKTSIEVQPKYDFELNDGMLRLDYGLSDRFALDLNIGATEAATRAWNPDNDPEIKYGLMDTQFGLRYRLFDERQHEEWYVPTLTLRLGGIIRGTYDADFPMAPGDGASGGEASILSTKTFKCGAGFYLQGGYRLRNNHVPQTVFGETGLSYTFKFDWVVNSLSFYVGYRGLYDLNGPDLQGERVAGTPHDFVPIDYTRTAQEMYQMGTLGLAFTDKHGRRYFFSCAHPYDGRNTGKVNNFNIGLNWPLR